MRSNIAKYLKHIPTLLNTQSERNPTVVEVLEIVAKAPDQTISEFLKKTILSMLECELEDNVAQKLRRKIAVQEVNAS